MRTRVKINCQKKLGSEILEHKLLSGIRSPEDVKKLNTEQIEPLCAEIRDCLIETVAKCGGHLASNLGCVELTVALHRVFDSPTDAIVFDVGHQCYTHKLLTGRYERFSTLRQEGGLSGFMRPSESEHDPITTGHSSNAISAAYGIYKSKSIQNLPGTAIAVVGDGAFTGGMAYEALNNAGEGKGNFIVILNDNKMSISKNVGALARYFSRIRSKPKYHKFKDNVSKFLLKIPFIGKKIFHGVFRSKTLLKNAIYHSNIFESLGFNYFGPIDGHDEKRLEDILEIAKNQTRPVLIHVMTTKGKGYKYAEAKPNDYHGVSPFDVECGIGDSNAKCFSSEFGNALCELAAEDEKVCAITAAMKVSTGLEEFSVRYKNRFFDVGIAEQHALTFAAGLAKGGMKPVFAVYSSFLQRAFDQIIHDAAISNVPITVCVDRAGFVGEDGETHQGLFDVSFLSMIPNVKIHSPANYNELKSMLKTAVSEDCVSVVRYPRGGVSEEHNGYDYSNDDFTVLGNGKKCVITYGRIFNEAKKALGELEDTALLKLNVCHPLPRGLADELKKYERVYFFEEGIKNGGVGSQVCQIILDNNLSCSCVLKAVDDRFVSAASVKKQLEIYGLDCNSIIKTVKGE